MRNKLIVFVSSCVLLMSASASAEGNKFQGLIMGINGSLASTNTDLDLNGLRVKSVGQTSNNVGVQIGFGYAATERAVFSFGATYRFSRLRAGQATGGEGALKFYANENYGIYFEPGFTVGNNTLLYALISYDEATGVEDVAAVNPIDSYKMRRNINGLGFGFGARSFFNDIGYLQIQVKKTDFDQESVPSMGILFEPNVLEGSIGIGFRY